MSHEADLFLLSHEAGMMPLWVGYGNRFLSITDTLYILSVEVFKRYFKVNVLSIHHTFKWQKQSLMEI